jgi:hypothetical protein
MLPHREGVLNPDNCIYIWVPGKKLVEAIHNSSVPASDFK